jgi:hypothetical protein
MSGAGNALNCDYRDPRHVERYRKLVIRPASWSLASTAVSVRGRRCGSQCIRCRLAKSS